MIGRILLVAVVGFLLLAQALPAAAQNDSGSGLGEVAPSIPGKVTNYDLAALTIPPTEFDIDGYGVDIGRYTTIDEDAATINTANDGSNSDLADVRDQLEAAGWQQSYYTRSGALDPDDQSLFAVFIYIGITRYKNADGAAAGYELLRDANKNSGYTAVRNADQIGDASALSKRKTTLDDGTPLNALEVLVQIETFVAEVRLTDYTGDVPDQATMLALGQTQSDILADAKPAVGLSLKVPQLVGDVVTTKSGYYARLNGDVIPYPGEPPKDVRSDEKYYDGIGLTNLYYSRQTLPSTSGNQDDYAEIAFNFFEFDGQDSAQAAYDDYDSGFANTTDSSYSDIAKVRKAATFGDDSATYSYTYQRPNNGGTVNGYRVGILVGSVMVVLYADSGGEVPLDAVETIADAAATCAGKKTACKPLDLPDGLAA